MQSDLFRRKPTPPDGRVGNYIDYNAPPPSFRDPQPPPVSPGSATHFPAAEILLGGYDSRGNGVKRTSLSEPRQRNTPPMDDPIATHLLVETALGDSQSYDILPYDELEALKREDQNLQNRVSVVRRQLALETKVRDAARSLNRLYSSRSSAGTSPLMIRRTSAGTPNSDTLDKAETQLTAATKKVDELSRELYHLEGRLRQTQMKLLQHTAGILQLTHRGPRDANDMLFAPGGRPESPASLDEDYDRNFDRGLDNLDGFLDELKAGNPKGQASKIGSREAGIHKEALLTVGRRLEDLNERMHEIIAQVNPTKAQSYSKAPRLGTNTREVDATVTQQLEHLSRGLADIQVDQTARVMGKVEMEDMEERTRELQTELQASLQENLSLEQQKNQLEDNVSGQLGNLNNELLDLLTSFSPNESVPSIPFNNGPSELLRYTEDRITTIKNLLHSLSEEAEASRNASVSNSSNSAQYEVVLEGLWQIILAGEEDSRERKRNERSQLVARRAAGEELDSDDDLSPDEDDGLKQEFSLQSFSTKVQWLVSKTTYMKEKQSSLRRKVKQHREGARARALEGPAIEEMKTKLERTTQLHETAKGSLQDKEIQLQRLQSSQTERDARIKALEEKLETAAQKARDEAGIACAEIQAKLDETDAKAKGLESQLSTFATEREENHRSLADQEHVFRKTESELRELESEVVRLTTELTISKAELDAAHGSRSQRKADAAAAANTEANAKLEEANAKNVELAAQLEAIQKERAASKGLGEKEELLKRELADTLKEFEELAKASVEAEKERDELENTVDGMREKIEGLEGQLAEDRVKWLGMGEADKGGPQQSTSAVVLKNEFKKMMRDTRTEHMKALRVCLPTSFPFRGAWRLGC
jgi:hypothetical protein